MPNKPILLAGGLIVLVIAFAILTQLPPGAFNYHDDFQKYLTHPVRVLATGTLFGSGDIDSGFIAYPRFRREVCRAPPPPESTIGDGAGRPPTRFRLPT